MSASLLNVLISARPSTTFILTACVPCLVQTCTLPKGQGARLIIHMLACAGNVATEDVVYMLNGFGLEHGIDFDKLLATSKYITDALGKPNSSRAATAMLAARQQQ